MNNDRSRTYYFFSTKSGIDQALLEIDELLSSERESYILFMYESSVGYNMAINNELKNLGHRYFNRLLIKQTKDYDGTANNPIKKMIYRVIKKHALHLKCIERFMLDYEHYACEAEFKAFGSEQFVNDVKYMKEGSVAIKILEAYKVHRTPNMEKLNHQITKIGCL